MTSLARDGGETTDGRRLVLSPHAALKTRAGEDVLVLPERAIRLAGSGGEILRLCLAENSESEIVRIMCERYPDQFGVAEHVRAHLAEMIELGGLVVRVLDTGGGRA